MLRRILLAGAIAVAGLVWGTNRADAQWGYYSGVQVQVARPIIPPYPYQAYSPVYASPYSVGYPVYSSYYSTYRPVYPVTVLPAPAWRYRVPAYRPVTPWPYVRVGY